MKFPMILHAGSLFCTNSSALLFMLLYSFTLDCLNLVFADVNLFDPSSASIYS